MEIKDRLNSEIHFHKTTDQDKSLSKNISVFSYKILKQWNFLPFSAHFIWPPKRKQTFCFTKMSKTKSSLFFLPLVSATLWVCVVQTMIFIFLIVSQTDIVCSIFLTKLYQTINCIQNPECFSIRQKILTLPTPKKRKKRKEKRKLLST